MEKPKKRKGGPAVVYRSAGGKTLRKGFTEPGRNEPCPCGSKKKFKNCCLDRMNAPIRQALVEAHKA